MTGPRPAGCMRRSAAATAGLFLRLGREQKRVALAAACFGSSRRLTLGHVLGVDRDHARTAPMCSHHHPIRLVLVHAKLRLQYRDDELPRRKIVVDENNLMEPRSFRLRPNLGA